MITEEMKNSLREVLTIEDSHERNCEFILALIKLGSVEELKEARDFLQSLPDELKARVSYKDDIKFEIQLRKKWTSNFESVDLILLNYPTLAKRVKGIGYKVALLQFAAFTACNVDYVCQLLEEIIKEFESRVSYIRQKSSLLEAIGCRPENPCWILRKLFLTEMISAIDAGGIDEDNTRCIFLNIKEDTATVYPDAF